MTYLELVNEVLVRLRESTVATIAESTYSTLIGKFVNESKRQVEGAYSWDALYTTLTVNVVVGTTTYTVTGSGQRQSDCTVNNTTTGRQNRIKLVPPKWIEDQQQLTNTTTGTPMYYAWNGTDGTDSKIEIYPTPDASYTLKVNLCVPQVDLSAATDVLTILPYAVIACTYARALVERGEDGGLSSSEAYSLYRGILSDQIALESNRDITNDAWDAV